MTSMFVKDPEGVKAHKVGPPIAYFKHRGYWWQRIHSTTDARWIWMPGARPFITTEMCQESNYELWNASVDWVLTNTPGIEWVSWPVLRRWFSCSLSSLQKRFKRLDIVKKNPGQRPSIQEPEDLGITELYPMGDDRPWGGYPGFRSHYFRQMTPEEQLYVSWRAIWMAGDVLPWMTKPTGHCVSPLGMERLKTMRIWDGDKSI